MNNIQVKAGKENPEVPRSVERRVLLLESIHPSSTDLVAVAKGKAVRCESISQTPSLFAALSP